MMCKEEKNGKTKNRKSNFVSYFVFARLIRIDEVISSGLSWFCSVLFAYSTNKLFVFESKTKTIKECRRVKFYYLALYLYF